MLSVRLRRSLFSVAGWSGFVRSLCLLLVLLVVLGSVILTGLEVIHAGGLGVIGRESEGRKDRGSMEKVEQSRRRRRRELMEPVARRGAAADRSDDRRYSPLESPHGELASKGSDLLSDGPVGLLDRIRARYDQPREALRHFLRKRLAAGEKDLSVTRYEAAREQAASMSVYSTAFEREISSAELMTEGNLFRRLDPGAGEQTGIWTQLGPGNIGGRTRSILINPTNPDIMYAAGVSGGVWKSVNAGGSWTPLTDLLPGITVSSMAFEPGNPETIYVGTGEGIAVFERDTEGDFRGSGIFRTTDGGANWSRLESTVTPDFYFVNDLIVSRHDKRRIYAATRTGVWRSLDGGGSWSRVLNPLGPTGRTVLGGCLDLVDRPDQATDTIFAACGTLERSTVYRNTDAGAAGTWRSVLTEMGMGRTALAISPSNPSIIYAVSTSVESEEFWAALHAVHRSTADGDSGTWVAQVRNSSPNNINRSLLSIPPMSMATDCGYAEDNDYFGQGWYDLSIAVDPLDSNRVWVGGIEIFRSDDGGVNWGLAGPSYNGPTFELGPIHPDHHVILFHPQYNGGSNQQLFVGNDGGVYRTLNARGPVATTPDQVCRPDGVGVRWQSLNTNFGVTQFYHGSVSPDGRTYYGGTQDNGTILGQDSTGINSWREILGGDGGFTAIDFINPLTMFASFTDISIHKSTDGGRTFGEAMRGIDDTGLFITPYAMDSSDPKRLWTGGEYIWRTLNGGATWERASGLTAGAQQVSALAISRVDSNRMLVGMADGYIHRQERALSADAQTVWLNTRPRNGYVSSLTFDPGSPDIAYATYSTFSGKHVWRTIDGGTSWTPIDGTGTGALPDLPVHSLVVDPTNSARLYIGTDLGVFVTTNGGTTWAVEYSGFANVITETLQLNVSNGMTSLYAFTHGRGVWRVKVNNSACRFHLSPATVVAESPSGSIDVLVAPGSPGDCTWETIRRGATPAWLSVAGRGAASGKATWSVTDNPGFEQRIGTVTIAGQTLTIIQPARKDQEAPFITVTETSTPAGTVGGVDPSGVITLAGMVRENDLLSSIRWTTDRGSSGSCDILANGTGWRCSSIPLGSGTNLITITAVDRSGNVGMTTREVTANPATLVLTVAGTGENGFDGDGGPAPAARVSRPMRMAFDQAGTLYFADADNNVVRRIALDGTISTVAGNGDSGFSGDGGPARQAALSFPLAVAVDKTGNLYICDNVNARIRKVNISTGVITTIAGNGINRSSGDGGLAIDAGLNNPQSIDVDSVGDLYIAESGSHRIRKITVADGRIQTIVGTGASGFSGDGGPASAAQLTTPNSIFVTRSGNLLISDSGNNRIRQVTASDGVIQTIIGNGVPTFTGDGGSAVNASINWPTSAISDELGNLYVADRGNQRIRRVDVVTRAISTIIGRGDVGFAGDGVSATASPLSAPTGLAIDPAGTVYFSDRDNRRVRKIVNVTADKIPPVIGITAPTVLRSWRVATGSFSLSGVATDNNQLATVRWFNDRGGMGAVTGSNTWRIDSIRLQQGLNRIRVVAWDIGGNSSSASIDVWLEVESVVSTIAGSGAKGADGDGRLATMAGLYLPSAIAFDKSGNLYIADTGNHRIRRVAPSGQITAYAGNGMLGSSGDGGPATEATLNSPGALAFDSRGNLYIADTGNHRIRRVSPDGIISTVAGNGNDLMAGDGGPATAASLYLPQGVAIDTSDNLLIADTGNFRVRKVDLQTGLITTFAGSGRYGSDGDGLPALQATFKTPFGLAVDQSGLIYVIDGDDHRVRRIDRNGIISAYAGNGTAGGAGDGGPATQAQLQYPSYITFDREGNLFIADFGNHRVRRVSAGDRRITTVVGNGSQGAGPDGVDPLSTSLFYPNDVAIAPNGRLLIADTGNHRVREIVPTAAYRPAVATSSASYSDQLVSRESIISIFGQSLAVKTAVAQTVPLPFELEGTRVSVRDAAGIERPAQLFFVSPGQINLLLPASTSPGMASVTVTSADGQLSFGLVPVGNTAPAIFTAAADGRGLPAAYVLRIKPDGRQIAEQVARYDPTSATWLPVPVDVGQADDLLFLVLFGTGWRFNPSSDRMVVTINNTPGVAAYAGPQGTFVGLDQLNLRLDPALAGKGLIDIRISVDGLLSNKVNILVK